MIDHWQQNEQDWDIAGQINDDLFKPQHMYYIFAIFKCKAMIQSLVLIQDGTICQISRM